MKNKYIKVLLFISIMFLFIGQISAYEIEQPVIPEGEIHTCTELLGTNLKAVIKTSITILQISIAIIAIVKGMMLLVPPIVSHDADALKKAGKTLATMAMILVIVFLFKPLLAFIGNLVNFDASCIQ